MPKIPGHTRIPNRIGWTIPRPAKDNFRITVAQHTFRNRVSTSRARIFSRQPTLVHFLLATLTALLSVILYEEDLA